ncbi:hypothetical protein BT96DRAFT_1003407 [Gymnopus androsaceus JB14]|uniref:Uncharacterized protein n=1 Tax=Gymnopus androsaceus JB14 TaxID=1447944 RepID=A0A6A4GU11_9AGAR|nr:hypothetical protein BT96DRAFT_1003407 [Gymnopus androsaceus JB14]
MALNSGGPIGASGTWLTRLSWLKQNSPRMSHNENLQKQLMGEIEEDLLTPEGPAAVENKTEVQNIAAPKPSSPHTALLLPGLRGISAKTAAGIARAV